MCKYKLLTLKILLFLSVSFFIIKANSKECPRPPNKRQAPEPARAAIPVSGGQSFRLRPVFASKLVFIPDARLRLTVLGDEPLDGTSRPAYPHNKGKRIYCSLFAWQPNVRFFLQPGNSARRFSATRHAA